MKKFLENFDSESGIASIETSMVFMIIFIFIMFNYEFLKFQNDMSIIALNESLATERVDLALLRGSPENLSSLFDKQLHELSQGSYFNAIKYQPSTVECYRDLSTNTPESCTEKSKVIKFIYEVKRLATSDEICDLFGLPVNLEREVVTVNDYYR
ncbi:hypothetical protein GWD52_19990 [Enterobacteriaceae bacterium 4M9]|nr:hypothetical protein [Enterobacteriaceae bacterium 4M9]